MVISKTPCVCVLPRQFRPRGRMDSLAGGLLKRGVAASACVFSLACGGRALTHRRGDTLVDVANRANHRRAGGVVLRIPRGCGGLRRLVRVDLSDVCAVERHGEDLQDSAALLF